MKTYNHASWDVKHEADDPLSPLQDSECGKWHRRWKRLQTAEGIFVYWILEDDGPCGLFTVPVLLIGGFSVVFVFSTKCSNLHKKNTACLTTDPGENKEPTERVDEVASERWCWFQWTACASLNTVRIKSIWNDFSPRLSSPCLCFACTLLRLLYFALRQERIHSWA